MIEQSISITPDTRAIWLIFNGEEILLPDSGLHFLETTWAELSFAHAYQQQIIKVGDYNQLPCLLIDMGKEHIDSERFSLNGLRAALNESCDELFGVVSRAWQVALFIRTHQFCGKCGSKTQQVDWEMAVQCSRCQHRCYPRISPCVIVAIRKGRQLLLAQGKPHASRDLFSVLAGFVESGETLEQAVHREVYEEVGVKIKNLRYMASQPWPFPHALMMGFMADYDSEQIKVDGKEILKAGWFDIDNLPIIPSKVSIAGKLIEQACVEIDPACNPYT